MSSRPSPPASRMTAPFGLAALSKTARTFCPRDSISTIGSADAGNPQRTASTTTNSKRVSKRMEFTLFRNHGGHVDLQQHALNGKAVDHQKRVGRYRAVAIGLAPAFSDIVLIADVGDVDDLLDDVGERRTVRCEQSLD